MIGSEKLRFRYSNAVSRARHTTSHRGVGIERVATIRVSVEVTEGLITDL